MLSKALSHLSPKAINKSLCQKASFLPYYVVVSAVQFRSERGQKNTPTGTAKKPRQPLPGRTAEMHDAPGCLAACTTLGLTCSHSCQIEGLVMGLSIGLLVTGAEGTKIPREGRKEAKLCEPDLSPEIARPHVPAIA